MIRSWSAQSEGDDQRCRAHARLLRLPQATTVVVFTYAGADAALRGADNVHCCKIERFRHFYEVQLSLLALIPSSDVGHNSVAPS